MSALRELIAASIGLAVLAYAVLVLPTGHIDPCRAVMARTLDATPRPDTPDAAGLLLAGAAEAALYQRLAQNGPLRCFRALAQMAGGVPVNVLR